MLLIWLFVVSFSAMLLELFVGQMGLLVPFLGLSTFYLVMVFGCSRVFSTAIFAGTLLDLFLGRSIPVFLIIFILLAVTAAFWRRHGESQAYIAQILPGFTAGLICATILISSENIRLEHFGWQMLPKNLVIASISTVISALCLPIFCRLLDAMAFRLGLPQYQHVQTEEAENET